MEGPGIAITPLGNLATWLYGAMAALAIGAAACGGDRTPDSTPTPEPIATEAARPARDGSSGTVSISMVAVCRLFPDGRAEIAVEYKATATGGARVGRVRLFVNDAIQEDTGLISAIQHEDVEIIPVQPGAQRRLRAEATPDGSAGRASAATTIQCEGQPRPGA